MWRFTLAVIFAIAGCRTGTQAPGQWERCEAMLEAGEIYAGQPVKEFLALIRPAEVTQDGNFTSYHFAEVPNYGGLTVVAKAGELVAALDWTDCAPPLIYFNTMSEAERSEYHKRTHLLPPPRAES